MSNTKQNLLDARQRIDEIDERIQDLIAQRATIALQVAELKQRDNNADQQALFYRPEREAQVLRSVMARNDGPLKDEEIGRLFREIMSACLALERPMKVAFLGPEGTFTQAAALKHFGHSVATVPLGAIDEVFREVEAGSVNYGVVPVENSTEGVINHTLDMFSSSPLKICGEVQLRIHHHFLMGPETQTDSLRKVFSHQQSLAQCRRWLDSHWPSLERVAVSSNAEAAKRVTETPGSAAIAGSMAAELYGLEAVATNIEDCPDNTTRFLVIGTESVPPSGRDKTSVLVSMRNKPGALYQVLEPFHRQGISLTRIETRPARSGTWAYVFYIDLEGHCDDPRLQTAFNQIDQEAVEFRVLGAYPEGLL